MISIFFIILAGFFNAIMDVLKNKYDKSIFYKWKNQNWANPSISWTNKYKPTSKFGDFIMSTVFVWLTDMWHFVKMLLIVCICFASVFFIPIFTWYFDILILYCIWGCTFELFYSYILSKKPKTK